jgi:DHA1 family tetracycline resistance protein-like MFS transporter
MTAIAAQDDKLDFKKILPIFVIVLVDLLGLTIIIPLLPLYSVAFGADPLTIGLIGASYPTMQLIGSPLLGGLSDRYGRRPVLIVSQIGTFIGFLLLGFANALPVLLLSRMIDGLSGANIVTAQAAITDSTTERTRAQGLGLIGAAFGLGFTIGPAIAGIALALTNNDYRVPAFIAAGFSLVSILLTFFWFKETLPPQMRGVERTQRDSLNIVTRVARALTNPLLTMLLILMFMQQVVFGGFEQLLALFTLSRLGMDGAGNALLFVFVGIILVLVQGKYIGPLSRRFGEHRLIYAGLGLIGTGLILTAITPQQPVVWYSRTAMIESLTEAGSAGEQEIVVDLPDDSQTGWVGLIWIMVALIPASIGGGILSPSINSLITKRTASSNIGSTLGVSAALVSLANAVTPLIGGSLFQFLGSTAPFLLGGIALLLLLIVATRTITSSTAPQSA